MSCILIIWFAGLVKIFFLIDSSVCPGRCANKGYAKCDFRNAPHDNPFWVIKKSVTFPDKNGLLFEIPIFTNKRAQFLMNKMLSVGKPIDILRSVKNFFFPATINFDFCKMTFSDMQHCLKSAIDRYKDCSDPVPIVITGHSKEFNGKDDLHRFLKWANNLQNVEFSTFNNFINLNSSNILSTT
jgi:hypothetical protein